MMSQYVGSSQPNIPTSTATPLATTGGYNETRLLFPDVWLPTAIVDPMLICASLWVAGSFVAHGIRGGKWTRKNSRSEKDGAVLYSAAVVSALLPVPRYVLMLANMAVSVSYVNRPFADADRVCEALFDLGIASYFIALLPAYFFLWYRQHSLYKMPTFRHMYTARVRATCWASMAVVLLAGTASVCLFVTPANREMTAEGCKLKGKRRNKLPIAITLGTIVCVQLTLFALFCYPIHKHRSATKNLHSARKTDQTDADQTMQLMIRLSKSMAACILSDLCAMIFGVLFKPNLRVLVATAVVYDLSIFLNLASLTYSFGCGKQIVLALCTRSSHTVECVQR